MKKATALCSSHCLSQLLSGTPEASRKKAVNTTNKICFVHLMLGKNCTATPQPPSTPKQDPKCKTSGSSLVRERRSHHLSLEAHRGAGRGRREQPPLSFWKKWSLSRNGVPHPLLAFIFQLHKSSIFTL